MAEHPLAELARDLQKYADDREEARQWGGPTMYPQNPITEEKARRYARLLREIISDSLSVDRPQRTPHS